MISESLPDEQLERRGERPTESSVLHLTDEEYQLKQMEMRMVWRKSILTAYIDGVDNALVKLALYQRYVAGKSWRWMAGRYGGSESSYRMMVVRYTESHPITWVR